MELIPFTACQRLGRHGLLRVHKFSVWGVLRCSGVSTRGLGRVYAIILLEIVSIVACTPAGKNPDSSHDSIQVPWAVLTSSEI